MPISLVAATLPSKDSFSTDTPVACESSANLAAVSEKCKAILTAPTPTAAKAPTRPAAAPPAVPMLLDSGPSTFCMPLRAEPIPGEMPLKALPSWLAALPTSASEAFTLLAKRLASSVARSKPSFKNAVLTPSSINKVAKDIYLPHARFAIPLEHFKQVVLCFRRCHVHGFFFDARCTWHNITRLHCASIWITHGRVVHSRPNVARI